MAGLLASRTGTCRRGAANNMDLERLTDSIKLMVARCKAPTEDKLDALLMLAEEWQQEKDDLDHDDHVEWLEENYPEDER